MKINFTSEIKYPYSYFTKEDKISRNSYQINKYHFNKSFTKNGDRFVNCTYGKVFLHIFKK